MRLAELIAGAYVELVQRRLPMLGIRLSRSIEDALDRHARAIGRPKSVIARDWIVERLERESIDAEMRRAAKILAVEIREESVWRLDSATDAWLRALDEEDGGYNWGPEGPPV